MSADVRHILLVPAEAHREALLGDGPCGSVPPIAVWVAPHWHPARVGFTRRYWWDNGALALAFDGQPTGPEGLARALAVLARREGVERRPVAWRWHPALRCWVLGQGGPDTSRTYASNDPHGVDHFVPALATPPEGLGDLLDLWALAVVGEARGVWRAEVVRG